MKKAAELSEIILNEINLYCDMYVAEDGRINHTESSIQMLNDIIEKGFSLYKYCIDKKLYENNPDLVIYLNNVAEYIKKLQITKENANKLYLSNALMIWEQAKVSIAILANSILDINDQES